MSPKLDPTGLEISQNLNPKRLQEMENGIRPCSEPIVVLRDLDGTKYVADGNHRQLWLEPEEFKLKEAMLRMNMQLEINQQ